MGERGRARLLLFAQRGRELGEVRDTTSVEDAAQASGRVGVAPRRRAAAKKQLRPVCIRGSFRLAPRPQSTAARSADHYYSSPGRDGSDSKRGR